VSDVVEHAEGDFDLDEFHGSFLMGLVEIFVTSIACGRRE
jgi:hypothetical protein